MFIIDKYILNNCNLQMNAIGEIGRNGLTISVHDIVTRIGDANMKKLLKYLTTDEKPCPGRPKFMANQSIRGYRYVKIDGATHLVISRVHARKFKNVMNILTAAVPSTGIKYNKSLPPPFKIPPERCTACPLYPYQQAVIDHLCHEDGTFGNNGIAYLQMQTGMGKSRLASAVIAHYATSALVVVPSKYMAGQWADEFSANFPLMTVGIFNNVCAKKNIVHPSTHNVTIIIVNTFRDKTADFLEGYGIIIFDEVHNYHSTENRKALWLAQTNVVLGLSATPDSRKDGLDQYIKLHIGSAIIAEEIPNYDATDVNFDVRVKQMKYYGDPMYSGNVLTSAGTMSAVLTIEQFMMDPARINLICDEILHALNMHTLPNAHEYGLGLSARTGIVRKHGIFVFMEHRDYIIVIRDELTRRMPNILIDAPEVDDLAPHLNVLRSGTSKDVIKTAASARIVLTTYAYSRQGISLQQMSYLILATPRRTGMEQVIGRILRRGSDEDIVRFVIDIIDMRSSLKSQSSERAHVFKLRGYLIEIIKKTYGGSSSSPHSCEEAVSDQAELPSSEIQKLFDIVSGN
jgi:hypothetical protein